MASGIDTVASRADINLGDAEVCCTSAEEATKRKAASDKVLAIARIVNGEAGRDAEIGIARIASKLAETVVVIDASRPDVALDHAIAPCATVARGALIVLVADGAIGKRRLAGSATDKRGLAVAAGRALVASIAVGSLGNGSNQRRLAGANVEVKELAVCAIDVRTTVGNCGGIADLDGSIVDEWLERSIAEAAQLSVCDVAKEKREEAIAIKCLAKEVDKQTATLLADRVECGRLGRRIGRRIGLRAGVGRIITISTTGGRHGQGHYR